MVVPVDKSLDFALSRLQQVFSVQLEDESRNGSLLDFLLLGTTNNFFCLTFDLFTITSESSSSNSMKTQNFLRTKLFFLLSSENFRQENCLTDEARLLEYFLIELIQLEHPTIRQRLFSRKSDETTRLTADSSDSSEQKNRSSKIIDEIEQIIYCLYGLVLRKSKMKHLNDHNCSPVSKFVFFSEWKRNIEFPFVFFSSNWTSTKRASSFMLCVRNRFRVTKVDRQRSPPRFVCS